jgi:hypothetical protein
MMIAPIMGVRRMPVKTPLNVTTIHNPPMG